jgi:dolichol-phosphate mannosyltransferase
MVVGYTGVTLPVSSLPMAIVHPTVSIVVPTYNERANIRELVERTEKALKYFNQPFEMIFIDDRSTDGTVELIRSLKRSNIAVHTKRGHKGKAFSLLEGFTYARGDIIAFIDADLQYPPEALPRMIKQLEAVDIVVCERLSRKTSPLRNFASQLFRHGLGKMLLGLDVDVQAGLKAFHRAILDGMNLQPTAWGLDYQLLYYAHQNGASMGKQPIYFAERKYGQSQVNTLKVALELTYGALKLRFANRGQASALHRARL